MKLILLAISAVVFVGCGKLEKALDVPEQIDKTNVEIKSTNESVRQQKIGITLSEMQKKQNREYLTPIPGDMLPYGKLMAEALTVEEALLFIKDYIKKINEEYFENRYPTVDKSSPAGQTLLAEFEHDKLADLMMITIVAGYLPDSTVNAMIAQESEQGAYRDIFYQILMLRVIFHNDLMLNASVLNEKLATLGKINKAIEYNSKVEFISRLSFVERVELKITGFSNPDFNKAVSRKLDQSVALTNWKRIYSAAQQDFQVTSFSANPSEREQVKNQQNAQFGKLLNDLQNNIKAWGETPAALN